MLERGRFPTALACSRVTRQVGAHLASRQPLPPPTQQEGEAASGQGPAEPTAVPALLPGASCSERLVRQAC